MDIRWKDGEGNILNADDMKIKYLTVNGDKHIISKKEVKKIRIENGLMNIFKDFNSDLALTVVIPKGNLRDATKIFNEYDKTGEMLKRKSGNFFVDLILESSVITYNPFTGILIIIAIVVFLLAILVTIPMSIFGEDLGLLISRILIIGIIAYTISSYVLLRIKRRKLKEN